MSTLDVVLLLSALLALGAGLPCWWERPGSRFHTAACLLATALLVGVGATLWLATNPPPEELTGRLVVALLALVAVVTGGPVTAAVLHGVQDAPAIEDAAAALRGGAWIGALERVGVFAALVAHTPEAVAVVIAVKGLGRYPELQEGRSGTAERFIVGTLASLLWATACAGIALVRG